MKIWLEFDEKILALEGISAMDLLKLCIMSRLMRTIKSCLGKISAKFACITLLALAGLLLTFFPNFHVNYNVS